MSDGKWSGGIANRTWSRGTRVTNRAEDPAMTRRLYESMKHERFWCEVCGQMHPLMEHQACRDAETASILAGRSLVQPSLIVSVPSDR